jgi:signal peptidase I
MSRNNHDQAKDAQFAVILSSILPGLGHFYNNRPIVGFTWLIVIWGLAGAALWAAIAPGIPLIVGIGLFVGNWILAIVQLFHTHRSVWRANNLAFEADRQTMKDPWLEVALSWIKRELSPLYQARWSIGFLILLFYSELSSGIVGFLLWSWFGGFVVVHTFYVYYVQALAHYQSGQGKNIGMRLAMFAPLIGGALLTLSILTFVAGERSIVGNWMLPTLQESDRMIINKLTYRFTPPKRGDLIHFGDYHIERIIGVPGETIEVKDGKVFIDGKALTENYIKEAPAYTFGPEKVPAGEYFVLGDNRNNDYSGSHYDGFVPRANIIGQATKRWWPENRMGELR